MGNFYYKNKNSQKGIVNVAGVCMALNDSYKLRWSVIRPDATY